MNRLIRPLLIAPALLVIACGAANDDKPNEIDLQAAETCTCLSSGDWLAAQECEQVHQQTLAALTDKPEIKDRLHKAVDACRPAATP